MRKLISKVKKVVVMAMGVIIALPGKIYAVLDDPITALYGVYNPPNPLEEFWKIARYFIIPIILLIGIIVYLTKKKTSTRNKVLIILAFLIIMAILYCIINAINSNLF